MRVRFLHSVKHVGEGITEIGQHSAVAWAGPYFGNALTRLLYLTCYTPAEFFECIWRPCYQVKFVLHKRWHILKNKKFWPLFKSKLSIIHAVNTRIPDGRHGQMKIKNPASALCRVMTWSYNLDLHTNYIQIRVVHFWKTSYFQHKKQLIPCYQNSKLSF